MFVSSTEHHRLLAALGTPSTLPERYGADFLWAVSDPENGRSAWVGVQRKEVRDLMASVMDGRLGKELAQLQQCIIRLVIIEGTVSFAVDGTMLTDGFGQPWTRAQWEGVKWSIQNAGCWLSWSGNEADTADMVGLFERWTKKPAHTSLIRREKVEGMWGRPGSEDYARHLLMGLPGVGVEVATRIVQRFGGVPWQWTVGVDELMTVEGVGKRKAEQMMRALNGK